MNKKQLNLIDLAAWVYLLALSSCFFSKNSQINRPANTKHRTQHPSTNRQKNRKRKKENTCRACSPLSISTTRQIELNPKVYIQISDNFGFFFHQTILPIKEIDVMKKIHILLNIKDLPYFITLDFFIFLILQTITYIFLKVKRECKNILH